MEFIGKTALITGGSRGIGRAIAIDLARRGVDIIINFFRNRVAAEETARAIRARGRRAFLVKAHVGDENKINAMFDEIQNQVDGLDILVCNAASGSLHTPMEQDVKGWDWTMNVNARSVLLCAQRAVPLMEAKGGGSIVNLSSLGSTRVLPNYMTVGVSKAAVEALTRYLAVDLAPRNITVNTISASIIETEALKHFPDKGQMMLEAGRAGTPAGRLVTPDDIARVVAFLCSPAAQMIHGQTLVVDGGYSLMM
jgi:enoyl-[acyl-carrier protein] reductase III